MALTTALTGTDAPTGLKRAAARKVRWVPICIATVLLIGGMAFLWQKDLKHRFIVKRWGVVEAGEIYRSGQISDHLIKSTLQKHGIQVVVDLTGDETGDRFKEAEQRAISELGIESKQYPLLGDGTGDIHYYAVAIRDIDSARKEHKPVLVHCYAGAQRTGGVVAGYRMLVEGKSPAMAYAEMKQYGWKPKKDRILLDYLNNHMAELAELLVKENVIARVPDPLPVLAP